jgi:lipocalin
MMMRGMTAKNFDPIRYSGRWFEVASLKRGFAGAGQEDCYYIVIYLMIISLRELLLAAQVTVP